MISQNQFVIVRMSCGIASFSCICHILSVVYIYMCVHCYQRVLRTV